LGKKANLSLPKVRSILGFAGERVKVYQNGRTEEWIWIDGDNHQKRIEAVFFDCALISLKGSEFK
jgi:hypothetical protein